jgi:hypothetical protein
MEPWTYYILFQGRIENKGNLSRGLRGRALFIDTGGGGSVPHRAVARRAVTARIHYIVSITRASNITARDTALETSVVDACGELPSLH